MLKICNSISIILCVIAAFILQQTKTRSYVLLRWETVWQCDITKNRKQTIIQYILYLVCTSLSILKKIKTLFIHIYISIHTLIHLHINIDMLNL